MLKYSMGIVYNDSVSVILLRWNTDRVRVTLHVTIFRGRKWKDIQYNDERKLNKKTMIPKTLWRICLGMPRGPVENTDVHFVLDEHSKMDF
jgi:hypothetical protein